VNDPTNHQTQIFLTKVPNYNNDAFDYDNPNMIATTMS